MIRSLSSPWTLLRPVIFTGCFVVGSMAACYGTVGCSLDWRSGPLVQDAEVADQSAQDNEAPDATGPGEDSSDELAPDAEPPIDAPEEPWTDCQQIASELVIARENARVCQHLYMQCSTSVTDECNCLIFVADADSAPTKQWSALLEQSRNAGCLPVCSQGCPIHPVMGSCAYTDTSSMCFP